MEVDVGVDGKQVQVPRGDYGGTDGCTDRGTHYCSTNNCDTDYTNNTDIVLHKIKCDGFLLYD